MLKKKLIYILTTYYPPHIKGGAEISTQILAKKLSSTYSIVIITPNYDQFKTTITKNHNLTIIKYKSFRKFFASKSKDSSKPIFNKKNPSLYYLSLIFYYFLTRIEMQHNLKKQIKKNKPTNILSSDLESGLTLLKAKQIAGIKKTIFIHDYGFICINKWLLIDSKTPKTCPYCSIKHINQCLKTKSFISRILFYYTAKTKQLLYTPNVTFIAVSNYVKKIHKNYIHPTSSIYTVSNFFNFSQFTYPQKQYARKTLKIPLQAKTILFVGNYIPAKGFNIILTLAQELKSQNIYIHLAGKGQLPKNLPSNIINHGFCSAKKLSRLYSASDILIFPSIWEEPFGRVIIEAFAHHLPVIAFPKGAIPELIQNNKNGWLAKDLLNMKNVILNFFQHQKLMSQKFNFTSSLKKFSATIQFQTLLKII